MQTAMTERRIRREHNRKQRENQKYNDLYNNAVKKGVIQEGSIEALNFKEAMTYDFNEVSKMVAEKQVEPTYTKTQNAEADIAAKNRKQLIKSGVKYMNPAVNNNIQQPI